MAHANIYIIKIGFKPHLALPIGCIAYIRGQIGESGSRQAKTTGSQPIKNLNYHSRKPVRELVSVLWSSSVSLGERHCVKFALCRRISVSLSSVCLSVTLLRRTKNVELFSNIFSPSNS